MPSYDDKTSIVKLMNARVSAQRKLVVLSQETKHVTWIIYIQFVPRSEHTSRQL